MDRRNYILGGSPDASGAGYERVEKHRKHRISTRLEAISGVEFVWSPKCGFDRQSTSTREERIFSTCGNPLISLLRHPPGRVSRNVPRFLLRLRLRRASR